MGGFIGPRHGKERNKIQKKMCAQVVSEESFTTFVIPKQKVWELEAKVAQLVEHDLAKVGVASSNLVFRSLKASTAR